MSQTIPLLPDERLDTVNEQIRLICRKDGLTFGTDAYLLAAYVKPQAYARAVDLGSGTGILSLLLCTKDKARSVTAVELQAEFAALTAKNATLNHMDDRIRVLHADLRKLNARDMGGEVDLVVANPPYFRMDSGKRNRCAEKDIARHETAGGIADFCAAAGRLLRTKGKFYVVWKPERLTELFLAMEQSRLQPKRMTLVHADLTRKPCAVLVEALKDGARELCVTPPLILYQPLTSPHGTRTLTPQAKQIYDTCVWI